MNLFAALIDRLAYEPSRNSKLRLLGDYFRTAPDPGRGYALAAMTGALTFANTKPAMVRALISARADPVLFDLAYDYVGDLSETVALMWPAPPEVNFSPALSDIVTGLRSTGRLDLPKQIAGWLDGLDETGRWALLKLITGGLRIGVSARLAKSAVGTIGGLAPDDIEEIWHGLTPPYEALFAYVEGRGPRPAADDPAPFRTPMLAHAAEPGDFEKLSAADFRAEWKWDGIRVQAAAGVSGSGAVAARLYSRTGEDISRAFPDVIEALRAPAFEGAAIDGELLIMRGGRVQSFNVLQQRLNRKTASAKLLAESPAFVRCYDLLSERGEDLRALPFLTRRARLEAFLARAGSRRFDLSPLVPFATWAALAQARAAPGTADAGAIEGVMIKRADSAYVPGRPKGQWYKWKRDPFNVDAVLMYAQRGHGKRSSFYSDFTFGVWRADELVPVGKAYFGFTDEELKLLDKFVRDNTLNRFGPVREVERSLVLEIAFEGLNRSTRHKSGLAMRFPRIARIRWDKPAQEADRIETLAAMLKAD